MSIFRPFFHLLLAGTFASSAVAGPVAKRPEITREMAGLREATEKALLSAGVSVDVFALTKPSLPGIAPVPYPSLMVWGYLSKASVYQIMTATKLIEAARQAGYRSVEIDTRGTGGRWLFDLTKPSPACANGLCF